MSELVMQTRWARLAQMVFIVTALSGGAACNLISGANAIDFTGPNASEGGGSGGGSSGGVGDPFALRCDPGSYVVGVAGRAGSWLDSFKLQCAPLVSGSVPQLSEKVGGDGGDGSYKATCPSEEAVVGLRFTAYHLHDYVLRVEFYCASPAVWKTSGATDYDSMLIGSGAGLAPLRDIRLDCPKGQVAVGIEGSASTRVTTFTSLDCIPAP